MKNLLILFCLFGVLPLFAQEKRPDDVYQKSFSIGIVGGWLGNIMPYTTEYSQSGTETNTAQNLESGYFAGVYLRNAFSNIWAVKMDCQYETKGMNLKKPGFQPDRTRISYININPQVEAKAFQGLHVLLGAYLDFRLEEWLKYRGEDWVRIDPDLFRLSNSNDWGLSIGGRYEIKRVSVLLKYLHGFSNAIDYESTDGFGETLSFGQRHRTIQAGLSFRIF